MRPTTKERDEAPIEVWPAVHGDGYAIRPVVPSVPDTKTECESLS